MSLWNRERRLRYKAGKKGLYIRKYKWREYYTQYDYVSYIGYCVGSYQYNLIIYGGDEWGENLPSLEEVEKFVDEY